MLLKTLFKFLFQTQLTAQNNIPTTVAKESQSISSTTNSIKVSTTISKTANNIVPSTNQNIINQVSTNINNNGTKQYISTNSIEENSKSITTQRITEKNILNNSSSIENNESNNIVLSTTEIKQSTNIQNDKPIEESSNKPSDTLTNKPNLEPTDKPNIQPSNKPIEESTKVENSDNNQRISNNPIIEPNNDNE